MSEAANQIEAADGQSLLTGVLGGTLWIAVGTAEGKRVYLPGYTGQTRSEVGRKVIEKAYQEGYQGNLDDRLAQLEWEIVCVRFSEVQPNGTKLTGAPHNEHGEANAD